MRSKTDRVIKILRHSGLLRPRDLARHGIPREHLRRLVEQGRVERVGRGLYTLRGAAANENQSLAEACKRVPHGIVCLLSALRFHGLTTQNPFQIWMAIDPKARRPKVENLKLRIVRMSGAALKDGVEEHRIAGVKVPICNPAKTVADCFKFRNKIGLEVAVEALREYRRKHHAGIDELWQFAKICRVARVMRPYLEALA
ncbi:MAG: type IV toxin-antitoxin system AbiEi family antitoxin domain-containing protein [Acidobacteria bacterium]|nr:type IV toxin-antitoxin system AbiEi family antitoxin domain-containing protein [Acidobacteriota bacterium]